MMKYLAKIGEKYGDLTIVAIEGPKKGVLVCRCSCGKEKKYMRCKVAAGVYVSCGCRKKEQQGKIANWTKTHGWSKNPTHAKTYRTWQAMLNRCRNKNQKQWANYGGRGITVCKSWGTYEQFFKDMGLAPAARSLDRIDNDRGYSKSNCRWATTTEQRRNSSTVAPITVRGVTRHSWEWAEILHTSMAQVRKLKKRLATGHITPDEFLNGGIV
jgi:hypothetical protein